MSSLLKEAIIDASALKAAALKNAESAIIAKYSNEVKDTIDKLLEQDELGLELGGDLSGEEMGDPGMGEDPAVAGAEEPAMDLGGDLDGMGADAPVEEVTEDNIPLGASNGLSKEVGVNLEKAPAEGEAVEFNLDLGALHEAIQELKSELEEDEEIEINEEDLEAMFELETLIDPEEEDDGVDSGEALAGSAAAAKADTDAMDAAGLEELTMGPGHTTQKPPSTAQNQVHADKRYDKRKTEKDPKKAVKEEEKDERWRDWKPGGDTGTKRKAKKHPPISPQKASVDDVTMGGKYGTNEDLEISEDLIDAIMEKLTVDMGASLSGWAGRSSESMRWEIEKALAHRRSSDFKEDFEDIKKAHDELVFENNQLKEHTKQYKETLTKLKESLQDINLSNGRLLYTNRVLRNTSLNERQKEKIVEAISNAGSVTEAKTIYNTLQSTMETKRSKPSPQSLSEAIGRSPSFIRASRTESKPVNVFSERMKKLAGIK